MVGSGDSPSKLASLDDAHAALLTMLSAEQIEDLKSGTVDALAFHHGLGTFIRNQWLRHGQLARIFAGLDVGSIDSMSGTILDSFVCKLRGQPFNLKEVDPEAGAAEE